MRTLGERLSLAVVFTAAAFFASSTPAAEPSRTVVFASGAGGYHTYRIPALTVTPKGTLLAFCEGRKTTRADHGDLDLVLRRSAEGGQSWGPTQLVFEEGGEAKITIGNPCPVVDEATGRIWLPFCRDNDDVLVTYSDDDGASWARPRRITADVKAPGWGWYATGPGTGIQLRHGRYPGRLVIPCDHSELVDGQRVMFSHLFFSDDHGATWKLGGSVERHTDECQVVELRDGSLLINMRNYWGRDGKQPDRDKMRAVAISRDGGQSWEGLRFDRQLIEPICQASLLSYPTKPTTESKTLLFSNPASTTARERMTVRLSDDGGQSWLVARLLHGGPSAYSCLGVLSDGSIGCLYEGGDQSAYEKIFFSRFTMDWLRAGRDLPKTSDRQPGGAMKRVLILCTGNSCRSQMAEALWEKLGDGQWQTESAGSKPAGYVHPLAVRAMRELDIDISAHASKSLQQFQDQPFDLVVTVCDNAKESCPIFPKAKATLHWPFDDPAHAVGSDDDRMPTFRRVRDEIRDRIRQYLRESSPPRE